MKQLLFRGKDLVHHHPIQTQVPGMDQVTLLKVVGDLQLGEQKGHFESPGRSSLPTFCT